MLEAFLALTQACLGPFALGDVGVDFEDAHGVTASLAMQCPLTGDHHPLAAAFAVHQLAFPLAVTTKRFFDPRQRLRKFGVQQFVGHAAKRLRLGKAVEAIRPLPSRIGEMLSETSMSRPSLRRRTASKWLMRSPRSNRARIWAWASSSGRSGGMSNDTDLPMISSGA